MSDSDDDTVVQVHPTARRPGYDPPIEYVQFLDAGGELVKLPSLKDEKKRTDEAIAEVKRLKEEIEGVRRQMVPQPEEKKEGDKV